MKRALIYIGILLSASGCVRSSFQLRTGDLLFLAGETSEMTGAITSATGEEGALNFSHVGIAVVSKSADSVLEASTEGGVKMTALAEFLDRAAKIEDRPAAVKSHQARTNGKPAVIVMRLRDTTGTAQAVRRAQKYLGLPYDYSYLPDNGKIYCSELVWKSFLAPDGSHRFQAHPMNFRASDGSMPDFWTELFNSLGEPVPQDVPGTNPNDMAQEESLECVHRYF